ncbi:aldehyde dehydrogenase family protein [Aspergillus ibericus CBS 121593]|uniref:aldehyde dehydrogenase (NAD(+)) n=1 Tax=Aspergillus ibericus CBS 121593 TaxID=1448316 RepID=A0A395GSI1_9EURO|nr:ALDH-like protein [Aspergillus ibericus CBS 121593]RAK98540.1 ALDH-like protein [Aspergillus ibericus CBS 121593]
MTESTIQVPGKPEVIENRLYINGEFVPSQSGATFDLYNPATEAHSASVYEAGPEDVDRAVAAAKAAFPGWSELGALQRAHYLEKWADNLEKRTAELSSAWPRSRISRPVDLELGGKSPLVIWDDADLSKAVPAAARSILGNSGQRGDFIEMLATTMKEMGGGGDPLDPKTTRGPQADAVQFERVRGYLQLAQEEGVKVYLGGGREGSTGYFVQPTILADVPESSRLVQEETFGPVVVVNTFEEEEDMMRRANDTEYGLYASVYTRDISRALRAAKRFEAGSVCVNCTSPTMAFDMPFGGWKGSGQGRELGRYATEHWTEVKSVFIAL